MYEVRFFRTDLEMSTHPSDSVLIGTAASLVETNNLRTCSRDLVVLNIDNQYVIEDDPCWLFHWEMDNPNSYAWQQIQKHKI